MNSRVPSMKQMVVQKRHTFAAGLKNERESRRIIFYLINADRIKNLHEISYFSSCAI